MPVLTAAERVGTTLAGKYRLDRILGKGGMGTVFAGVHTWTGRQVAVKMLNPENAVDNVVVERFLQEAKAAARLEHPNVVDVLDMGRDDDGAVYLVLELLQGEPLTDIVARGPMPASAALTRLLPVVDALSAAHAHGIVHRDLKPDNIFLSLTPQGRVVPKLLDFGIAKVAGGRTAKTTAGFIVGTPDYMSPEQAQGKDDLGPASDVWSMGVVLFQCLTGKLPFEAESSTGLLVEIVTKRAPSVRSCGVEVPRSIAKIVDRALQKKPSARYANAGELGQALHEGARAAGLGELRATIPPAAASSSDARDPGAEPDAPGGPTLVTPAPTAFTWGRGNAQPGEQPAPRRLLPWVAAAGLLVAAIVATVVAVVGGGDPPPSVAPVALATRPIEVAPPPTGPVPQSDAGAEAPAAGAPALGTKVRARHVRPGSGRVRPIKGRGPERGANGAPILD